MKVQLQWWHSAVIVWVGVVLSMLPKPWDFVGAVAINGGAVVNVLVASYALRAARRHDRESRALFEQVREYEAAVDARAIAIETGSEPPIRFKH